MTPTPTRQTRLKMTCRCAHTETAHPSPITHGHYSPGALRAGPLLHKPMNLFQSSHLFLNVLHFCYFIHIVSVLLSVSAHPARRYRPMAHYIYSYMYICNHGVNSPKLCSSQHKCTSCSCNLRDGGSSA